ncbi:MAG: PepSY domain-containing protein [Fimbriimonadaceae bacterium]|nr:PepSY domain-containing protein [Fimbriimonadaceae bacterium]
MNKRTQSILLAAVGVLAVSGLGTSLVWAQQGTTAHNAKTKVQQKQQQKEEEEEEGPEQAEAPNTGLTARVTISQAAAAATKKVAGYVNEAKLEKTKSGALIWDMDVVTANHKVMGVDVDAKTGKVVTTSEEGGGGE